MSHTTTIDHTTDNNTLSLWAMMFGNFLIGTGVLLPAGLLNDLSTDFAITPARAGLLSFVGGLVVGAGAPLFATFTSRFDRRLLLSLALLLYSAGHLAAALAPSFELQLWIRAITIIGAAIFTPQAAATVNLLLPPEKRAAMAALSFLGTLAIWFSLKPGLFVQPLGLAAWGKALGSPVILLVFLVTLLSMSGQFTMFAYIAPLLKNAYGASPLMISMAFLIVGIAGVTGNSVASRIVGKFGVDRIIAMGLASLCIGFIGFALSNGNFTLAMLASLFWGLGSFSSNSLQQSRLAGLALPIASATIALNTSFVYLGQATGAKAGGYLMDMDKMANLPWMAFGFMALALIISLIASRVSQKT
jgi:MFS transporter, DHA1 family, inner membrane transport protein